MRRGLECAVDGVGEIYNKNRVRYEIIFRYVKLWPRRVYNADDDNNTTMIIITYKTIAYYYRVWPVLVAFVSSDTFTRRQRVLYGPSVRVKIDRLFGGGKTIIKYQNTTIDATIIPTCVLPGPRATVRCVCLPFCLHCVRTWYMIIPRRVLYRCTRRFFWNPYAGRFAKIYYVHKYICIARVSVCPYNRHFFLWGDANDSTDIARSLPVRHRVRKFRLFSLNCIV